MPVNEYEVKFIYPSTVVTVLTYHEDSQESSVIEWAQTTAWQEASVDLPDDYDEVIITKTGELP